MPSWSEIVRALAPLLSSTVATVFLNVCGVTHSQSAPVRTSERGADVVAVAVATNRGLVPYVQDRPTR